MCIKIYIYRHKTCGYIYLSKYIIYMYLYMYLYILMLVFVHVYIFVHTYMWILFAHRILHVELGFCDLVSEFLWFIVSASWICDSCMHINVHICMYTHMFTRGIQVYFKKPLKFFISLCTYKQTHTMKCTHTHSTTYTPTQQPVHLHTYANTHTCTRTHAHIHTHTHTHTHTRTHTSAHTRTRWRMQTQIHTQTNQPTPPHTRRHIHSPAHLPNHHNQTYTHICTAWSLGSSPSKMSGALQCVAVCCSVLQCVAVFCRVLQCVAVCCSVLQCVATCCNMLQSTAACCTCTAWSPGSPTSRVSSSFRSPVSCSPRGKSCGRYLPSTMTCACVILSHTYIHTCNFQHIYAHLFLG